MWGILNVMWVNNVKAYLSSNKEVYNPSIIVQKKITLKFAILYTKIIIISSLILYNDNVLFLDQIKFTVLQFK